MFPAGRPGQLPVLQLSGWRAWLRTSENLLLSLLLGALVALPLVEALLRELFGSGISAAGLLTQHLVLMVAMLGGAVAARDARLLSLGSLRLLLGKRFERGAVLYSSTVGALISALLAFAAAQYIVLTRSSGKILAYGIPVWVVQLVLPVGFALIAWRIVACAARRASTRVALVGAMALLLVGIRHAPLPPPSLVLPSLVGLAVAALLGAPIFSVLGGTALILFWGQESPIASLAIDHYRMVVNPTLPAIPLFTLAGYFLAEGGASKRLIRLFDAWVGGLRGGPAILTAVVCAFFTSFTGASGVTILALGGLLMPVLRSAGHGERQSLGLLTGAGSLGLLFPPALPLILYAVVATSVGSSVTLEQVFLAGIVPGILLVAMVSVWGVIRSPKRVAGAPSFALREALAATWVAKWELGVPLLALVALFGGLATPVEAAALTAAYAFVVEALIHRDLKPRQLNSVMAECALLVGGVLLILGVAMGFTNYLVDAQVPDLAVNWAQSNIHSPWVFLLVLNLFLLLVGCLMDIFSAIVVVVPLIVPVAAVFGIDPVHLGILFLANLELGYLTPPVGMNLFLAAYRFDKPMPEVIRASLPMFLVLLLGVLLITYIPVLTTALPGWLG